MNANTCRHLIPNNGIEYVIADEVALSAARATVNKIAERNAVLRLLATCELIAASMSVVDQPAMHKRLTGDIQALKSHMDAQS